MLIDNEKLNIEEFKTLVPNMTWLKLPRNLGTNHSEYFYSGKFEDDSKLIQVTVRPSLWISVTESFKNRRPQDGLPPTEEDIAKNRPLVDWGSYIEINIDENFLNKIKELAKSPESRTSQTVSW